ncbi:hypothetical protein [Vibrio phage vB_VhaP_PG11]|nr:hypothetical protein [Vibrio phage vB_VhaP_PG11]
MVQYYTVKGTLTTYKVKASSYEEAVNRIRYYEEMAINLPYE